jgi:nucleotide-binding universal stress UspA family protein
MGFEAGLKTIVVATDLDGRSEAALEYGRKIAGAYGARIVLSYGLDPLDYASVDTVPGAVLRTMPEAARAVLHKMSEELSRQGIHSHSEVRQGTVVQTLLDVAKRHCSGRDYGGVGPACTVSGPGGLGRLECGSVSTHTGRSCPAGAGTQ